MAEFTLLEIHFHEDALEMTANALGGRSGSDPTEEPSEETWKVPLAVVGLALLGVVAWKVLRRESDG